MTTLSKSDFDFAVLRLVLELADIAYDQRNNEVPASQIFFDARRLTDLAEQSGKDKTELLLALAPAVEQCRNGLNPFCEQYAQRLVVVCLTSN